MGDERNQQQLFENQTNRTKDMYKEFLKISGNIKVLIIIGIPSLLLGIALMLLEISFLDIFFLIFGVFLLLVPLIASMLGNFSYKKSCEINGGNMLVTIFFYDDYLLGADANSTSRYEYAKIGKILESKNLFILVLGNPKSGIRISIPIGKFGFTKGDYESFKHFICVKTGLAVKLVK